MASAKVINIVKGEDKLITIRVISKTSEEPYDLTGAAITAKFMKTDGTALSKAVGTGITIVNPLAGKMEISLSDTDTTLLKDGEYQDFEIAVTISSNTSILQFRKVLNIYEKLFA